MPRKTHPASPSPSRTEGATANVSSQSGAVDGNRSGRRRSVVFEFDFGAHVGATEQEALAGRRDADVGAGELFGAVAGNGHQPYGDLVDIVRFESDGGAAVGRGDTSAAGGGRWRVRRAAPGNRRGRVGVAPGGTGRVRGDFGEFVLGRSVPGDDGRKPIEDRTVPNRLYSADGNRSVCRESRTRSATSRRGTT